MKNLEVLNPYQVKEIKDFSKKYIEKFLINSERKNKHYLITDINYKSIDFIDEQKKLAKKIAEETGLTFSQSYDLIDSIIDFLVSSYTPEKLKNLIDSNKLEI